MKTLRKAFLPVLAILLFVTISFSNYNSAEVRYHNGQTSKAPLTERENLLNYPKDTRERYIASVALRDGITFEEADRMDRASEIKPANMSSPSLLRVPPNEVTAYKTVDKRAGYVSDKSSRDVNIAAEIKYKKKFSSNTFVRIEDVGELYIYMPGMSTGDFSTDGFNVDNQDNYARISATGSLTYHIGFGFGINAGVGDIASVEGNIATGLNITTKAKTFVINVRSSDL